MRKQGRRRGAGGPTTKKERGNANKIFHTTSSEIPINPPLTLEKFMALTGEDPNRIPVMKTWEVELRLQVVSMINDGFLDLETDREGKALLCLTRSGYLEYVAQDGPWEGRLDFIS